MTHAQADALIATLPKPGRLRLYREGDWIMMTGGESGSHSIAVRPSSAARLIAHWRGYVENQKLGHPVPEPQVAAAIADASYLAREAYRALCAAKDQTLTRETLVRKLRVGRWKSTSHAALSTALSELGKKGLVTVSEGGSTARYTAVCSE